MRFWPVILVSFALCGCIGLGFPSISRTQAIVVPTDEARAFRVVSDVTMSGPFMTGPIAFGGKVEEIAVREGVVDSQSDTYFAYYYLVFPILNGSRARTLEVLLYRPGFAIVEIPARPWWRLPSSNIPERVAWTAAPDLPTQKAAIDRIAPANQLRTVDRSVLQFAASEYDRLADRTLANMPTMTSTKSELQNLARKCREVAEEAMK